ncbi:putative cardiolipin synthase [Acinetobacter calcoaceticus]|uniref:Putative cardiolipin synthase n=1 Tax=Acinetobacter calcoaceticus TaxID=471 RepID=A0A4R1XTH7_ACICA|nr:putative cardiolipin synthase [Acinetobacter calcoaceticus]
MNQSQPDKISTKHLHHWMHTPDTNDKLAQGLTAYLVMDEAFQSIAARLHLIREAKVSLDLQYYIWADDFIGNLMLSELLAAADRGVQVRLLIDDQNGRQLDKQFQALMQHPNIHIKLYNPYKFRTWRVIDYVFRTKQINRRMHNKLIVADGALAVTGGRNISSEYFDASESFQFTDLDVLFFGPVVANANQSFIDFWNNELSYPVSQYIDQGTAEDLVQLRTEFDRYKQKNIHTGSKVDQQQQVLQKLLNQNRLSWAPAYFLADDPIKTQAQASGDQLIYKQIINKMNEPKQEIDLISAYFVPTQLGTDYLSGLPKNNVKVRILTNSFVANDVALVHAFYQKYRQQLLKSGVKLYEFKPYIERYDRTWYEVATGNVIPAKQRNKSSLHAKFINVDEKVFIGSFNFDPRSVNLNTEVGLLIESNELQEQVSIILDHSLPRIAYELKLDENGELLWLDHQDNGQVVEYNRDPQTTGFQRFVMHGVAYLPIEGMM